MILFLARSPEVMSVEVRCNDLSTKSRRSHEGGVLSTICVVSNIFSSCVYLSRMGMHSQTLQPLILCLGSFVRDLGPAFPADWRKFYRVRSASLSDVWPCYYAVSDTP